MKQRETIVRTRTFKIVVVLFLCLFAAGTWMIGPTVWNMAVVLGVRPWNMRPHSRQEVLTMTEREPLRSGIHLIGKRERISALFKQGGDIDEGGEPAYLVFDRDGFLLRQHACFESMPGFLDSTMTVPGWFERDTSFRLDERIRDFRLLHSMMPFIPDSTRKTEYTVILGWNDHLRHAERKIDSFLVAVRTKPYSVRVLLVNTNAKDSSFTMK